jgi:uncharacterized protein (TIGR03086 family)
MNDVERYRRVAAGFDTALRGVTDSQWELPTPCTEWNVTQLVTHVVDVHYRVLSMATGPRDHEINPDLRQAWREAMSAVLAATDDPTVLATPTPSRFGERPFSAMLGGLLTYDTLCHTWDLQRATGQVETLDPELVAHAHDGLSEMSASMRVPGGFAEELETPEDADAQTRFLRFTGRDA